MDSTIADYNGRLVSSYIERYPREPYIHAEDSADFYISKDYEKAFGVEAGRRIRYLSYEKGFFLSLDPIPGAVQACNEMLTEGYQVYLCTSPQSRFENCVDEKYQWVLHHMGRPWTDRMILTKDKTLIQGDILIDDKPNITGLLSPSWVQVIFSQPYNLQVNKPRIVEWSNWRDVVYNVLGDR